MRIIILLLGIVFSHLTFAQVFANDTTLSGTYNANGKIMYISAKISGDVTITNAIIEANPFIQIFDTTVTLGGGVKCERFSGMWYGAKPSLTDNSRQLQYAINACINKPFPLYIPGGSYKTSQPLMVVTGTSGNFQQSQIKIYGDATFWDRGTGTQIVYSGDSCALGLQLNKGSEISNLIITGKWISPSDSDSVYFNRSVDNYTNQGTAGNGEGIWIDPVGNYEQKSGSTGCLFHDLKIENFNTLIKISNSKTQNGEIMEFDRIQFGDAQYGVYTYQPQEKLNVFNGVYSWGSIHTLFHINNGNYYIKGANVAGRCIRLFDIKNQSWFPTHISNIYAENIGTIGLLSTNLPLNISNSIFDFISSTKVGALTLLNSTTNFVKFDNSQFRYYGETTALNFSGTATFENCLFSGTVTGLTDGIFVKYENGIVDYNASQILKRVDTIVQPPQVKISLRRIIQH